MANTFHFHHQGAPGANNLRGGWGASIKSGPAVPTVRVFVREARAHG